MGEAMLVNGKKRVELRNDPDGQLDEVVVRRPDFVHFERMSDQSIWCGITVGEKTVHVRIGAKNNRSHVYYFAEID